jgi:Leucine-rich repeat (LRR) protein
VKAEVNWALSNRPGHVVPVLIDGCHPENLHLLLTQIQFIDFSNDPIHAPKKLLSLWPGDETPDSVAYPILQSVPTAKFGNPKKLLRWAIAGMLASAVLLGLYLTGALKPREPKQANENRSTTADVTSGKDRPSDEPDEEPSAFTAAATDQPSVTAAQVPEANLSAITKEIVRFGGKYAIDDNLPEKPIVELDLRNSKITDAELILLKDLPSLRRLFLGATSITDAGLAHVAGLSQLEALDLTRTIVGDAGLVHLKGLVRLEELTMYETRMTGSGLSHLQGLPQLGYLFLDRSPVSDEGLAAMATLRALIFPTLAGTKITDEGLRHLRHSKTITHVSIEHTATSDAGIEHLATITQLESLDASGCPVSDSGIAALADAENANAARYTDQRSSVRIRRSHAATGDVENRADERH